MSSCITVIQDILARITTKISVGDTGTRMVQIPGSRSLGSRVFQKHQASRDPKGGPKPVLRRGNTVNTSDDFVRRCPGVFPLPENNSVCVHRKASRRSQWTSFYVRGMASSNSGSNLEMDVTVCPGIFQTPDQRHPKGLFMSFRMLLVRNLDDFWTKSYVHF